MDGKRWEVPLATGRLDAENWTGPVILDGWVRNGRGYFRTGPKDFGLLGDAASECNALHVCRPTDMAQRCIHSENHLVHPGVSGLHHLPEGRGGYQANIQANSQRRIKQDWWWAQGEAALSRTLDMGNSLGVNSKT